MTKAVRNRILKDANGHISDHLRNHIHLTNCIHLKNHMHKQSPILADRSLMRDLIVLQRSRSLRDPSASPPSWHSPSVVDLLPKKGDKDAAVTEGRRSIGIERRREGRRLSGGSPPFANLAPSKVVPGELSGGYEGVAAAVSDRSSKSGARDGRRIKREESSRKSNRADLLGGDEDLSHNQEVNGLVNDDVSGNSESKSRKSKHKGKHSQDFHIKTLSDQLNEIPMDSDVAASSNVHLHGRRSQQDKTGEERETSIRGYSGINRTKRRKFRGARRTRATPARDVEGQNEMSVASNSLNQGSVRPRYCIEEEEYGDSNVTRAPRNGCGIPWNWSRIHHRGKTFLDMAGRSLSCGLSDSRLRKGGMASHDRDAPNMPVASDYSCSSTKSDAEALPLLVEASLSQESTDNAGWVHDYSGELGIYADHLLKNDVDSDLASEARSGGQHKLRRNHNSRHQNFTQKYMPRTFRDLVGQNLVAQALSNAVVRRKVGLLYVFYGPHGTGKTSCARIFARALNCQSLEHPKPCGYCNSCIAHDMGKSRNIREVGPVSNFDFGNIVDLLDNMIISHLPSQYRVFIFDGCDTLSSDCWSAISKVIDRAPRRVVFVLVSSSLDVLPHIIISRCQKFFFPKLKDADIIYTLQWIASKEDIDIDKDALKLIASRSDGSLRDAQMTLEQLSLLGLKISVPLVQELVGLISDEKLVDLLDLALSADTVNTVKHLRVIMETGVEPLALMSQLATVITDILAGSYNFTKERHRRKFFRRQPSPIVQLMFSSHLTKLKAEKFRAHILQAFESVFGSQITLEIRCESNRDMTGGFHLPAGESLDVGRSEIVEIPASPREIKGSGHADNDAESSKRALQRARAGESVSHKNSSIGSMSERRKLGEPSQSKSLVRSKVSLAHVIQQAEGCTQQTGWSKRKAVSIAEKLEQENLRLEPRSRSLLCWKASRVTRRKLSRLKIRTRKPHALLKLVSCGKCISSKSPR
ncbi:protein STICHEL-like 3 isoform X2 [Ricinus communis]|uniref:protein STICHEL-like 3 isoform X2 n=1 Tax=Ricinus communis TaxID=3988 RepID=UPI00201AC8EE|nr:protein STICHEL-like 3 isoform X2 [Ricinus communis]